LQWTDPLPKNCTIVILIGSLSNLLGQQRYPPRDVANGTAKKIDPQMLCKTQQFGFHALLAMVKTFAGDGVISEQEITTKGPISNMFNTSQLSQSRHASPPSKSD
jgi:hypothetical protein